MADKRVVMTGAHSYLGQKLLRFLSEKGGYEIAAFITPWAKLDGLFAADGIRYIRADLTKPLDETAAAEVKSADRVLHFAWVRSGAKDEILKVNLSMIANLKAHLSRPEALVFISSVAASPETLSRYGQTKFEIANQLKEFGAIILVTGLIVDKEPRGPYELLVKVVKKLPFSVRFTKNSVKVYPIRTDDFLNAIDIVLSTNIKRGIYRVYPTQPDDINDFLAKLEKKQVRGRLRIPVSYGLSMSTLRALHGIGVLPSTLGEKLLTFLYKDDTYLSSHATLPGTEGIDRPLEEMI